MCAILFCTDTCGNYFKPNLRPIEHGHVIMHLYQTYESTLCIRRLEENEIFQRLVSAGVFAKELYKSCAVIDYSTIIIKIAQREPWYSKPPLRNESTFLT